jgi:hypothetical protein
MGPMVLMRDTTNGPSDAQYVTLPMVSNGPSLAPRGNCRWSQMGPVVLMRDTTDGLEWVQ